MRAKYKLSLLSHQINNKRFEFIGPRDFKFPTHGWGRDKFLLQSELYNEELGYLVNNKVIFQVEMTVYGELKFLTMNRNGFISSLLAIYQEGKSTDIVIVVGG